MEYDIIVVGGGAAGLMAAGRAAGKGKKVLLLEKMSQPGRKLLITGKGRCNITNDASISEFIKHVYPNGRFLQYAFSCFFSADMLHLLEEQGVRCKLERGGRYFPASEKSYDVLQALLQWLDRHDVEIRTHHRAEKLIIEDQHIKGIQANGEVFYANKVILTTGGKSYPATGSTGEGYELARQVGHHIVKIRPSLVPLETQGDLANKLQGLSLKNVNVIVWINNKKQKEAFGEMLFTHFGLSGPVILTLSRFIVDELTQEKEVKVTIDLKPALDDKKLDNRLLRDLDEHGKKKIGNIFRQWLPSAMIPVFIEQLHLDPEKEGHQLTAKERKNIRHMLKHLSFTISHHRSFKEAVITAGGVSTKEIDPKTMASKIINDLYFAGEVVDMDAETGGYNLQIAWSTGWLAGDAASGN